MDRPTLLLNEGIILEKYVGLRIGLQFNCEERCRVTELAIDRYATSM